MEIKELYKILLRYPYRAFQRLLSFPLSKFERSYLLRSTESLVHPPVFIIGPPRSGTTLLYQALIARYYFAYFTNFTARFYYAPIIAFWLAQRLIPNKQVGSYTSRYGQTTGWYGPHECGEFWYRWFPRGEHVYVAPGVTHKTYLRELRSEIIGMSRVTRAPVLFKNTYNSMRIAPIIEALPEAFFLVCRRDIVDTAESILKGRERLYGTKERWMGVPPKEIDRILSHPYWQQVVEQVYYIYRQIEKDKQRFAKGRFLDIRYDELCNNPNKILDDIGEFLAMRGLILSKRNSVPERFPFSTGQKVGDDDYAHIVETARALQKQGRSGG